MKIKLLVAVIVFAVSMFCGSVIVTNGILAGRFNSMYPYTAGDVCSDGEKIILETDPNATGSVVIENTVYSDVGYTANTLYCVNETSGEKREVTEETYNAFEKLKTKIGWGSTIGFFLVTMILILLFERPILRRIDKVIGYKSPEEKKPSE